MKKQINFSRAVAVSVVSAAVTGCAVFGICIYHFKDLGNKEKKLDEYFEIQNYIDENYYEDVDDNKLFDYALKGMVSGLGDDYAAYMTPEEYEQSKILSLIHI